jgi:hypothetical protein
MVSISGVGYVHNVVGAECIFHNFTCCFGGDDNNLFGSKYNLYKHFNGKSYAIQLDLSRWKHTEFTNPRTPYDNIQQSR